MFPLAETTNLIFATWAEAWLRIDGETVIEPEEHFYLPEARRGFVSLDPGRHRFELGYLKQGKLDWQQAARPELALFVRGPGFRKTALHQVGGVDRYVVNPILLDADTPQVVRSFADVGLDEGQTTRIMQAINVGSPQHLHYTLDYQQGTLVRVWRGEFLDATPMWHQRGDGSSRPRGAEEFLTTRPIAARLANERDPWPDRHSSSEFRPLGYRMSAAGLPEFQYSLDGVDIRDALRTVEGKRITRQITLSDSLPDLYFLLAEAAKIEFVTQGLYAVDDKRYYVRVRNSARALVRETDEGAQLLSLPNSENTFCYEILF